jgi:hypothetical protein
MVWTGGTAKVSVKIHDSRPETSRVANYAFDVTPCAW